MSYSFPLLNSSLEATSPVVSLVSLLVSILPSVLQGLLVWFGKEGTCPIDHPLPGVRCSMIKERGLGSTAP